MTGRPIRNSQIADEAADWVVTLDQGALNAAQKEQFATWLLESPRHVEELLLNASLFGRLDGIDAANKHLVDDLLSKADAEIVSIPSPANHFILPETSARPLLKKPPGFIAKWSGRAAASIAAALLSVIAISFHTGARDEGDEPSQAAVAFNAATEGFETQMGEQRKMSLQDGSTVHLNTQSKVVFHYSENERLVELQRGEALFEVAHDPQRPFRVVVGETVAEAIGTAFNIYRTERETSVAVIEGKVAVKIPDSISEISNTLKTTTADNASGGRVLLQAGQKADVALSEKSVTIAEADAKTVSAWRIGQLVFEAERLDAIIEQFNRYNRTQLFVTDPDLSAAELSGVFDADDPEALIETLELMGGVTADRSQPLKVYISPNG